MWHAPIPPSGIRRERSLRSLKVHPRPRTPSKISSDVPGDYMQYYREGMLAMPCSLRLAIRSHDASTRK